MLVPGSAWGDESPWLARVESTLATGARSVTLLVNGGEIARIDVAKSLANRRPVLIIAGTGHLADEMATAKRPPLVNVVDMTAARHRVAAMLGSLLTGS